MDGERYYIVLLQWSFCKIYKYRIIIIKTDKMLYVNYTSVKLQKRTGAKDNIISNEYSWISRLSSSSTLGQIFTDQFANGYGNNEVSHSSRGQVAVLL